MCRGRAGERRQGATGHPHLQCPCSGARSRACPTGCQPRVHHEPCRFVHYQDMLVLEDHGDGDLLGREILLGDARFHVLSAAYPVGRIGFVAIDEQEVLLDESLHEAAADPEPPGGQPVDALPGL